MEQLEQLDRDLFLYLNGLHAEWLDPVMVAFSNKFTWIPLYLLLIFLLFRKFGWRHAALYLLGVAVLITLCDRLSVEAFKEVFDRYRPCHNLLIKAKIHLVDGCGGKFGFVSSHATNHFGLSTYLFLVFRKRHPHWGWWLFLWAAITSYSRIYLGVHYPADIVGGAILGIVLALIVYGLLRIVRRQLPLKS